MPTTETIIVAGIIAILGLIWLAFPFFRSYEQTDDDIAQKQLERLLVYYEQVMATLRDLEHDFSTGKLNQADYEADKEVWMARGIKVLDAINQISDTPPEAMPQHQPTKAAQQHNEQDIDAAIEAAVQKALRAK
jgi:primosomal protein N''